MKFTIIIVHTLCVCFSVLVNPCVSSAIHVQEHTLHEQEATDELKLSVPTLPRKLRLLEEVTNVNDNGGHDTLAYKKQKGDTSGDRKHQKENQKLRSERKGTWQEWIESTSDKSQFFTMDYSHVRRRRPIHNKSIPVGP
ncbi:hypothetical protein K2173_016948 [Erythroxylum novogranatense]|uniref:Root meristem growth factor 8 n=1 Tax=Erythroxylum novogranatense TaxID=1862640 RepID=A0AAV8U599_9ROSI|nr:hypothetical protein K2173_016948 [Erythroxylum novogranatense]